MQGEARHLSSSAVEIEVDNLRIIITTTNTTMSHTFTFTFTTTNSLATEVGQHPQLLPSRCWSQRSRAAFVGASSPSIRRGDEDRGPTVTVHP